MLFCIECKTTQLVGGQKKYCSRKCKNKYYDRLIAKRKREEEETFPIYICQCCGNKIQLDYDPRLARNAKKFNSLRCNNCGNLRQSYE